MSDARGTSWRRVLRLVAVLVAAMQLLVIGASVLDADAGRVASAHVEEQGVRLHWTHDAAECGSCAARHLVATPLPSPAPLTTLVRGAIRAERVVDSPVARLLSTSRLSRAPPSVC
jgi:hypothetical protein